MSNPTAWWLCAPYLLYNLCGYAMLIWTPQVVRTLLGVSDQRVGLIMGLIGLIGVASMLGSAALSDRRNERVIHGTVVLLIVSLGLSIVASGAPAVIAVVALACAMVSNNGFLPVFWCLPPRFLRGTGAAAGIALINSVGNLGGFIGPTVIGTVKTMTGGFTGAFAVLAGLSFLSALLMLTLARSSALGRRAAPAVDPGVRSGGRIQSSDPG